MVLAMWNFNVKCLVQKTKTFCLMHQSFIYVLHFLFLLLINYIDCRRFMETADFTPQIFLLTLPRFSPKIEFFHEDSLSFMVQLVLPYFPEMTDKGIIDWGW